MPVFKNYAAAAAAQNTTLENLKPTTEPLPQTEPKPKQARAPTPKEARWAKKITVNISNKADKEKI